MLQDQNYHINGYFPLLSTEPFLAKVVKAL